MASSPQDGVVLALDAGSARIGVAVCRLDVRLARPLTTIAYNEQTVLDDVRQLVRDNAAVMLVVGWPRGLDGQPTRQTQFAEDLAAQLRQTVGVPVFLQDEALTSQRAEAELKARRKPFAKGEVDALAATYILEDFIQGAGEAGALAGVGGREAGRV